MEGCSLGVGLQWGCCSYRVFCQGPAHPHHLHVLPEILHSHTVSRPQGDAGGPQQLGCVPVVRVNCCG